MISKLKKSSKPKEEALTRGVPSEDACSSDLDQADRRMKPNRLTQDPERGVGKLEEGDGCVLEGSADERVRGNTAQILIHSLTT